MVASDYTITPIVSARYEENSYVVHRSGRADCLIVDPGFGAERIVRHVEEQGLSVAAILNTHGHCDHIAGNGVLKERWPEATLVIGKGDAAMLSDPEQNLSAEWGVRLVSPAADRVVSEGHTVEAAGFRLDVLEVPGHTPGHVVYLWRELTPAVVFGGDVLFAGSIGRADFPYSDLKLLLENIRQKLLSLPDETVVYPGHGGPTTIGMEKELNPFLKGW